MSNDTTLNLPNGPSFEDRLFARLDTSEGRLFSELEALAIRIAGLEKGQERIEEHNERIEDRMQSLEERQDRMDERLERMDDRLERMDDRLERMETRLDDVDQRLQVLEQKAYDTRPIWEHALAEILELREDVHTLHRKFNVVNGELLTLKAEQSRLEVRMDKVDSKPV